jgi:hypothetical protein
MHSLHVHAFFAVVAVFILACAVTPKPVEQPRAALPQSSWGGQYKFTYNNAVKDAAAASEQITIAVVYPDYRLEDSALRLDLYKKVGGGFSESMGSDIDKVLIGKGMTTKGPYPGLEEITYGDKKASDLTLAPKVFLSVQTKYIGGRPLTSGNKSQPGEPIFMGEHEPGKGWFVKDVEVIVSGWFVFGMQEPLSAEKMWLKRIELEDYKAVCMECYEGDPNSVYHAESGTWYQSGYVCSNRVIVDQKPEVVADALKRVYPTLLDKLQTYIDVEELKELKKKTKEIRELKRY